MIWLIEGCKDPYNRPAGCIISLCKKTMPVPRKSKLNCLRGCNKARLATREAVLTTGSLLCFFSRSLNMRRFLRGCLVWGVKV
jgi:hypothetical protein